MSCIPRWYWSAEREGFCDRLCQKRRLSLTKLMQWFFHHLWQIRCLCWRGEEQFPFHKAMLNCSQNCWNSAALCFKQLLHSTYRGTNVCLIFVWPLLPIILCIWEIWSSRIPVSHYFQIKQIKKCVTTHRFGSRPMTRNQRLFWPNVFSGNYFKISCFICIYLIHMK